MLWARQVRPAGIHRAVLARRAGLFAAWLCQSLCSAPKRPLLKSKRRKICISALRCRMWRSKWPPVAQLSKPQLCSSGYSKCCICYSKEFNLSLPSLCTKHLENQRELDPRGKSCLWEGAVSFALIETASDLVYIIVGIAPNPSTAAWLCGVWGHGETLHVGGQKSHFQSHQTKSILGQDDLHTQHTDNLRDSNRPRTEMQSRK